MNFKGALFCIILLLSNISTQFQIEVGTKSLISDSNHHEDEIKLELELQLTSIEDGYPTTEILLEKRVQKKKKNTKKKKTKATNTTSAVNTTSTNRGVAFRPYSDSLFAGSAESMMGLVGLAVFVLIL